MRKEKILLDIVTKDGSSLALQVSYLKFKPWSRIFLPEAGHKVSKIEESTS